MLERKLPLTVDFHGVVLEKYRCPICGHSFDEVEEVNVCPTRHYGDQTFIPEQLITDNDDYARCI